MGIKKNDFVEIEFTGKYNDNIFDTTNKEEAKLIGLEAEVKPVIISVGNEMLLKGFDDSLEGKEIGKKYSIHLAPKNAFGSRNPSLIKTLPIRIFKEKNMNPVAGVTIQLDNHIAKILSVSGGRVSVDFNNPLAGKEIDYDFVIKGEISDNKEKINSLQDFFFRNRFDFEIKDNKVIFKDEKIKPIIEIFKEKFKEMTSLDFVVEEKQEEKKIPEEKEKRIKKGKEKINPTITKQQ